MVFIILTIRWENVTPSQTGGTRWGHTLPGLSGFILPCVSTGLFLLSSSLSPRPRALGGPSSLLFLCSLLIRLTSSWNLLVSDCDGLGNQSPCMSQSCAINSEKWDKTDLVSVSVLLVISCFTFGQVT